jgi:DNA-binding GntR family transcriptional regulator
VTSDPSVLRDRGADGIHAPSLVVLAADAIRRRILSGDYAEGERLLEERLTEELAISRPPLREAFRTLETEGLIVTLPRRGTFVTTMTEADIYEILTLRSALERMAFDLGIPVDDVALLRPAERALEEMKRCAREQDRGSLVQAGYAFHFALVGIAHHRRLKEAYAAVQQQLLFCMARNLIARERYYEDLEQHVARHERLLEVVKRGDKHLALKELAAHGERSFEDMKLPERTATEPS